MKTKDDLGKLVNYIIKKYSKKHAKTIRYNDYDSLMNTGLYYMTKWNPAISTFGNFVGGIIQKHVYALNRYYAKRLREDNISDDFPDRRPKEYVPVPSILDIVDDSPCNHQEKLVIHDLLGNELNMREIGKKHNRTPEYIRQVKNNAVAKLKLWYQERGYE